jgi:membrane protease YdiL (CAAX protease family)
MALKRWRRTWSAIWRILAFVIVGVLPPGLIAVLGARVGIPLDAPAGQFTLELLTLGSVLLVAWLMLRLERTRFSALGLSRSITDSLCGFGVGGLWLSATLALAWLGRALSFRPSRFPVLSQLALLALVTSLNAAMQEILFRGYPYFAFESRLGPQAALIGTTALFIVLHLGAAINSPLALVNLALAGFLFGLLRRRSGNLWFPIGVHSAWNVLLGPALGLAVSGKALGPQGWHLLSLSGSALITGGKFGLEGGLATTASTAIALAVSWRWLRKKNTEGAPERTA